VRIMSLKSQLYPLFRTREVLPAEYSTSRSFTKMSWGMPPDKLENVKFLRSRLVYDTSAVSASAPNSRDSEVSRNYRDMILGLALAIAVSASFWTGVALLMAKVAR